MLTLCVLQVATCRIILGRLLLRLNLFSAVFMEKISINFTKLLGPICFAIKRKDKNNIQANCKAEDHKIQQ